MGNTMVATIDVLVAMHRHHPLAFQCLEQHTVTEVGRRDRLGFLNPRTIECTAFTIGDTLGIDIVNPTGPNHP